MSGDVEDLIKRAAVVAIFLLVAFPVHEFSHALAAYRLGDSTARYQGRLTLNPIAHFDPLGGTLLAISILFLGFGFGWAKPTPVNPYNLRNGRRAEAIVALAGPISNLLMAIAVGNSAAADRRRSRSERGRRRQRSRKLHLRHPCHLRSNLRSC